MKNCKIIVFVALLSLSVWTQSTFAEVDCGCTTIEIKNLYLAGGTCATMLTVLIPVCVAAKAVYCLICNPDDIVKNPTEAPHTGTGGYTGYNNHRFLVP